MRVDDVLHVVTSQMSTSEQLMNESTFDMCHNQLWLFGVYQMDWMQLF